MLSGLGCAGRCLKPTAETEGVGGKELGPPQPSPKLCWGSGCWEGAGGIRIHLSSFPGADRHPRMGMGAPLVVTVSPALGVPNIRYPQHWVSPMPECSQHGVSPLLTVPSLGCPHTNNGCPHHGVSPHRVSHPGALQTPARPSHD